MSKRSSIIAGSAVLAFYSVVLAIMLSMLTGCGDDPSYASVNVEAEPAQCEEVPQEPSPEPAAENTEDAEDAEEAELPVCKCPCGTVKTVKRKSFRKWQITERCLECSE